MEFCHGSDLDCLLRVHKMFPEKEAKLILAQLMNGLVYLNELECPIIHYDLKPGKFSFFCAVVAAIYIPL
jgi:tousled-like kinase